ncbi:SsrA-binding protein [Flavobacteriaceae bacterium YJPT1-3]|nr:SsrA-binding protein [Flavobacteriaceae bacterium YJPT1-3]
MARLNKSVLPSFTKQNLDLAKAKKWQLALFGYKLWVTKRALD